MRGTAVVAVAAMLCLPVSCAGGGSIGPGSSGPCHPMSSYAVTAIGLTASTTPTTGFKLPLGSQPVGLIVDGESAWVLATGTSHVTHVMADGSAVDYVLPPSGLGLQLSEGSDGTVWVPEQYRGAVASIAPDRATVRECTLPGRGSLPVATSVAADGSVWISEQRGRIAHLINERITEFPIGVAGVQGAELIADQGGGAWFTVNGAPVLGHIAADGVVKTVSIGGSGSALGLLLAPDGSVWVADFGGDRVVRVAPDQSITELRTSSGAKPQSLAVGPGNTIWLTESGGDHLARVRGSAVEEVYRTGSWPDHLATTADGWAWFTEYNDDRLGRLRLS